MQHLRLCTRVQRTQLFQNTPEMLQIFIRLASLSFQHLKIVVVVLFLLLICRTHNRLLVGMSCCDFVVSSWFFLTTWPIPRGTPGIYGAVGTQASCEAQGFFSQFSIAVVMYNASLSVYYFVKIRKHWSDTFIKRRVEPFLHLWAWLFGLATSTAALVLDLYNNDSWECWIAPNPPTCQESWKHDGESTCVRGDNASLFRWVFYYAPLWTAITVVTVLMILVYRAVRSAERGVERYADGSCSNSNSRKYSKRVATQGYWYCGAFYLTWLFPTITRLTQLFGKTPYPLILITAMFVPIQGFFNCLVFIHPRWKTLRGTTSSTFGASNNPSSGETERQNSSKSLMGSIFFKLSQRFSTNQASEAFHTKTHKSELDEETGVRSGKRKEETNANVEPIHKLGEEKREEPSIVSDGSEESESGPIEPEMNECDEQTAA